MGGRRNAEPPRLTAETYATIRDHVLPARHEIAWRDIPWRTSLSDAVTDSRHEEKPILLWAMDGHPLGSTCSNGIAGRHTIWPDGVVRELAAEFIPVADDAGALQRREGPTSELFRTIAEQGHFAGQTVPTSTRQGIYAAAPSGELLASINSTDPRDVERMLITALDRWRGMSAQERRRPPAAGGAPCEDRVPSGGDGATGGGARGDGGALCGDDDTSRGDDTWRRALVLRVCSRDLPRDGERGESGRDPWNLDHAWFTADEASSFVPEGPVGTRRRVPAALTERLARYHLVDNVRGQSLAFDAGAIEKASLAAEVVTIHGALVTIRLDGEMRASQRGAWPVRGHEDLHQPAPQERGYHVSVLGHAVFDGARRCFTAFELVAAGMRWGATQYNDRTADLAPAPIGVVFALAADDLIVAPALHVPSAREHRS